jgi:hypothetical protein
MHQKDHWAAHKRMCVAPHKPEEPLLPTGVIFIRNEGECVWASINKNNPGYCPPNSAKNPLLVALQKCIREFTDRTGLDFDTVWSAACTSPEVGRESAVTKQIAIRSNVDLMIHLHRAGFLDITGKEVSVYPCLAHTYNDDCRICRHTDPCHKRYKDWTKIEKDWENSFTKAVSTPIRPLFHVWSNKGKPIVIPPQMLEFALIRSKFNYNDCCDNWNSDDCLNECSAWAYQFHGEKVLFHPSA